MHHLGRNIFLWAKYPYSNNIFSSVSVKDGLRFKDTEATCVEIATGKNALGLKTCPILMFSEIFSPYRHVLAALFRK